MTKLVYSSEKKINAAIRSIKTKGETLSRLIHETAIQCLLHACQVGKDGKLVNDARPMGRLFEALPNGTRKEGFKLWVQMFSPIRWNGDGAVGVMKETAKGYKPYDVETANLTPFWNATKENEVKTISPEALLALIKRETDKILSANDQGEIANKEGEVTYRLGGNVVQMKAFARRMKELAEKEQVNQPKSNSDVPAALKAASNLPVVVTTSPEIVAPIVGEVEPISKVA